MIEVMQNTFDNSFELLVNVISKAVIENLIRIGNQIHLTHYSSLVS